jgi:hypothetical protein
LAAYVTLFLRADTKPGGWAIVLIVCHLLSKVLNFAAKKSLTQRAHRLMLCLGVMAVFLGGKMNAVDVLYLFVFLFYSAILVANYLNLCDMICHKGAFLPC